MLIPVVFKGGKEGGVSKDELQYLIVTEQILFFKRSDGWAVFGRDRMRHERKSYDGAERREHQVYAQD
jgi:hypothetical protein